MPDDDYDVIIIGGRCAGASLALRLAGHDLKILLLDRATFPSAPSVPSAPHVHPGAMRLLDELGIGEFEYTHPGGRVEYFVVEFADYFSAAMATADMGLDRNYFYGIDRSRFDKALWEHAAQAAGVTARDGFAVTQILKDDHGAVAGVTGQSRDDDTAQAFTADLIVGADGRFSFAAREFGAKVTEERNDFTSAVYHAEWENVDDYSSDYPSAICTYNTAKRFMVLLIPIAERKYLIGTYMPSQDAHFGPQGVEQAYTEGLQRVPTLWTRLKNAQRVTDVSGIRPVENGYREAAGAHWALVGDALHYKDPVDGQGIYDALIELKLLAQAILDWKLRGAAWEQAAAAYQQGVMDETYAMFKQTAARVKQTLGMQPPPFVIKTFLRYLISDPDYQRDYLRYLSRAIHPADYKVRPADILKILGQGIAADLGQRRHQ